MKNIKLLILTTLASMAFWSCEEEYFPDTPDALDELVVEGYIEVGEGARPVYVLLTRAIPFFSELSPEELGELYVRDAEVEVADDLGNLVRLTQVCWSELDPAIREEVARQLGFPGGELNFDLCAYVDLLGEIEAREGGTYRLSVRSGEHQLSATTSIPFHATADSLWFEAPRGEPNDTMAELWCRFNDPPGIRNYYRYQTAVNDGVLLSGFSSVTDDAFFDGKMFDFPLSKGEDPNNDVDPDIYGYFKRGDTVRLKWMSLDSAHYQFWQTLESSRGRQGPFSSYVRIASNIEGGLGIWGGYAVTNYQLEVPPQ